MTVMLERSNSPLGRFARRFGSYPYTHITISFDGENFHSFSRRHLHDPFDSGYTVEKLNWFAYEDVLVKMYHLEISDEQKDRIMELIEEVKDYPFDIRGMICTNLGHPVRHEGALNCMSFTARVLAILDIDTGKKDYGITIKELEDVLIREGYQGEEVLIRKMDTDEEYLRRIPFRTRFRSFLKAVSRF